MSVFKEVINTPSSNVYYYQDILPDDLIPDFDKLWNLHPIKYHTIYYKGRAVETPRWQQAYGKSYSYSGNVNMALEIPELLQSILDWSNNNDTDSSNPFNMILINWYLDGTHSIAPHSDDTRQLVDQSSIWCFSFGQIRKFTLENKQTLEKTNINLENNSLITMNDNTQGEYRHSIPKTKKDIGKRISITLRKFK